VIAAHLGCSIMLFRMLSEPGAIRLLSVLSLFWNLLGIPNKLLKREAGTLSCGSIKLPQLKLQQVISGPSGPTHALAFACPAVQGSADR